MDRQDVWWRLPGPSRFIADIGSAMHTVPLVGVSVPEGSLPDYMVYLNANLSETEGYRDWIDISLGEGSVTSEVARQVMTLDKISLIRKPTDLVGLNDLDRTVIAFGRADLLRRFDDVMTFAAAFAAAAARGGPRPTILLDIPAKCLKKAAIQALGSGRIEIIPWRGYVNRHDMISYVSHLMANRTDSPLTDTLLTAVVAHVARWDPMLASLMASWERDLILNPWLTLRELASRMKRSEASWEEGTANDMAGKSVPSAVWLALFNMKADFDRLVWSAHLSEIFPWLEERRFEFIEQYRATWTFPIYKGQGDDMRRVIQCAEDMELGEIFYNLNQSRGAPPPDALAYIEACKDARHDLAHRRPVSAMRIIGLVNKHRLQK